MDRLLLSEDDDSGNGAEYECVAGQGALVGPICVKVESIGENVLFL